MTLTYYCSACWQKIAGEQQLCPHCGYEQARDQELSFEDRLIRTLEHPVPEKRLLAIQILGDLDSQAALPELKKIIAGENRDIYELLETLVALNKINHPQSRKLLEQACHHPYPLVSRMACRLLGACSSKD